MTLYEELYISLYLNYMLITAHLYGLRIVIQLMVLPFYKNMLSKPLTFSHVTLTLLFYSKSFILKFSHKFNLGNTLYVSKSINNILSSLFSEAGFCFHLTNTIMKNLGLPLAIFMNLFTKLTFMARILLKQLMHCLRHWSPNKIKKSLSFCQIQISKFLNWCLIFQIL